MSIVFSCTMFFLSFTPLWISVVFIDLVSIFSKNNCIWTEKISIIMILMGFCISGFLLLRYLRKDSRNETLKYTLLRAKEEKTISIEFLLAYVMPLFAFDFTKWQQTILFIHIYFVLCWLCVKHKHFSNNVVFEALGYSVYSCGLETADDIQVDMKVISRNNINLLVNHEIEVEYINNDFSIERNATMMQ